MTAAAHDVAIRPTNKVSAFPHHYELAVTGTADGRGWISAGPRPEILGGAPSQFGGHDDSWSPEHLLLSAVSLCLLTTFRALADARGLTVNAYASQVKGILDRTDAGLAFTSIVLRVELTVAEAEKERAAQLLERAKRLCIVSNALKPPVDLRVSIVVG